MLIWMDIIYVEWNERFKCPVCHVMLLSKKCKQTAVRFNVTLSIYLVDVLVRWDCVHRLLLVTIQKVKKKKHIKNLFFFCCLGWIVKKVRLDFCCRSNRLFAFFVVLFCCWRRWYFPFFFFFVFVNSSNVALCLEPRKTDRRTAGDDDDNVEVSLLVGIHIQPTKTTWKRPNC